MSIIQRLRAWIRPNDRAQQRSIEALSTLYMSSLEGVGLASRTLYNKRAAQQRICAAFQGRQVATIRPWEVARLIKSIHDQGLAVTSGSVLHEMRAMLNVAMVEGWIDTNPAAPVKKLPAPVQRTRLTLDAFWAIHDYGQTHLPPWFPVALRLALVTGQRRGDLVLMSLDHIRDGHLFIEQQKTGMRIALPLDLRLDVADLRLANVIEDCRRYLPNDAKWLLRSAARPKRQIAAATISNRFWTARKAAAPHTGEGTPPTLHEIRSLAARLYRAQGVDTQTLLGHAKASMTELYENDRGLARHKWKYLQLPE
ncbi:hypothetical protein D8I35_09360 [Corticibacter populi]|uniref:Tyr recombinase domain-containing protein n=1 Tax=Corticibacter populi TaxID=1550736 RepID=A0A3M6QUK0_9BURK|nr:tyrosine-type recombinase/integrase [Corticibacter populi]RMX06698.1 hypothetical protein D8I35_09360 [Corticibacter populi]RZS31721.1 phage integrase family protein [Corticibacter populi]